MPLMVTIQPWSLAMITYNYSVKLDKSVSITLANIYHMYKLKKFKIKPSNYKHVIWATPFVINLGLAFFVLLSTKSQRISKLLFQGLS